jgi:hypothetical protein
MVTDCNATSCTVTCDANFTGEVTVSCVGGTYEPTGACTPGKLVDNYTLNDVGRMALLPGEGPQLAGAH